MMSNRDALADRTNANNDSSRILFSSCKGETHTPKTGFRQLSRRLRTLYKTDSFDSNNDFTLKSLSAAAAVVFGNPQQKFTAAEFEVLKQYLGDGGSVIILSSEGGELRNSTNLNYLIEEFGININSDCVIRLSHDKYLHPKEALIADGILNRQVAFSLKGSSQAGKQTSQPKTRAAKKELFHGRGGNFLYARGATLTVQKPSVPFLGTGQVAYPMRRPTGEVLQMLFSFSVSPHTCDLCGLRTPQPNPLLASSWLYKLYTCCKASSAGARGCGIYTLYIGLWTVHTINVCLGQHSSVPLEDAFKPEPHIQQPKLVSSMRKRDLQVRCGRVKQVASWRSWEALPCLMTNGWMLKIMPSSWTGCSDGSNW